jgi:tripartite-type tricarboxylate transporter receptor subunit TctC
LTCDSVGNSQSLVEAGKLRGLAITSAKRLPAVPGIPTVAEAGVPDVEAYLWLGLLGPAGLPKLIANKLSMEVRRIMNLDDVRERVSKGGYGLVANTPQEFADGMLAEQEVWTRVIKEKNIKSE